MRRIILIAMNEDGTWLAALPGQFPYWQLYTWEGIVYEVVRNPGEDHELSPGAVVLVNTNELEHVGGEADLINFVNPYIEEIS